MNPNATHRLERYAVEAHRRGDDWAAFWRRHGREVCKAARPGKRFDALLQRLIVLVESGTVPDTESRVPSESFPGKSPVPAVVLPAMLPQMLPAAPIFGSQTTLE